MFRNMSNLTSIDISNFKTNNLKTMRGMFRNCTSLTSIDLSNFNTEKLEQIDSLFYNCEKLSYIDISSFSKSLDYENQVFTDINLYGTIIVNRDLEEYIKSFLNNENWNITIKE